MKKEPTEVGREIYFQKLLNKFKQDPDYELKQEFGNLLMKHILDFTQEERKRYNELKAILIERETK